MLMIETTSSSCLIFKCMRPPELINASLWNIRRRHHFQCYKKWWRSTQSLWSPSLFSQRLSSSRVLFCLTLPLCLNEAFNQHRQYLHRYLHLPLLDSPCFKPPTLTLNWSINWDETPMLFSQSSTLTASAPSHGKKWHFIFPRPVTQKRSYSKSSIKWIPTKTMRSPSKNSVLRGVRTHPGARY